MSDDKATELMEQIETIVEQWQQCEIDSVEALALIAVLVPLTVSKG